MVRPVQHIEQVTLVTAGDMSENVNSEIADYRDNPIGAVQVYWQDVVGSDGQFQVFGSLSREPDSFDDIRGSIEEVDSASGTRLFNLGLIGYRYVMVKWIKGSVTAGQCRVVAMGKKT